jgi:hypothetical protein
MDLDAATQAATMPDDDLDDEIDDQDEQGVGAEGGTDTAPDQQ